MPWAEFFISTDTKISRKLAFSPLESLGEKSRGRETKPLQNRLKRRPVRLFRSSQVNRLLNAAGQEVLCHQRLVGVFSMQWKMHEFMVFGKRDCTEETQYRNEAVNSSSFLRGNESVQLRLEERWQECERQETDAARHWLSSVDSFSWENWFLRCAVFHRLAVAHQVFSQLIPSLLEFLSIDVLNPVYPLPLQLTKKLFGWVSVIVKRTNERTFTSISFLPCSAVTAFRMPNATLLS